MLPVTTIVGRLTADPELRFTPSGAAVCSFTVAANDSKKDPNTNVWEDGPTLFMRCSVWRQQAENVAESLTRGLEVVVVGKIGQREFETREGEKRTVIEMDCFTVAASLKGATAKVVKAVKGGGNQASSSGQGSGSNEQPPY